MPCMATARIHVMTGARAAEATGSNLAEKVYLRLKAEMNDF